MKRKERDLAMNRAPPNILGIAGARAGDPPSGRGAAHRRGTAGVAAVLLLIIVQLLVVVVVLANTRDQNQMIQRVDAARAFYACEGGENMAIRELMSGTDEDANGVMGGISSKSIGSATATVSATGSGPFSLTGLGTSGLCRFKAIASVTTDGGGGSAQSIPIVYGDNTVTPKYRSWTGSAWSAQASTSALDNVTFNMAVRVCPIRNEWMAGIDDNGGNPQAMIFNGTTWTNKIQISQINLTYRSYYVGYEHQSGDGLMACWDGGGGNEPKYRTWNGSAWSATQTSSVSSNNSPNWIRLVPKRGSNEIVMLCLDSNSTLRASVWDGSTFGNTTTLSATVSSVSTEACDAAYDGSSGRCLVCWGGGGAKLWTGSSWVAAAAPPNVSGITNWVRLGADVSASRIACVTLDSGSNVKMSMWDGSTWTASTTWTTAASNVDRRCFDVCFEPSGLRAVAMYSKAANTPYYRVFDGISWGAELTGPDISSASNCIELMPGMGTNDILIGIYRKADNGLTAMRWNGSALTSASTLTPNMGNAPTRQPFAIGDHPAGAPPRIKSWASVEP